MRGHGPLREFLDYVDLRTLGLRRFGKMLVDHYEGSSRLAPERLEMAEQALAAFLEAKLLLDAARTDQAERLLDAFGGTGGLGA